MTIIKAVGGILGPRPTGASFRTGVWKTAEVYERRVDGVWVTPTYPDLAPYTTNANGEILVATYNTGKASAIGHTIATRSYVKSGIKYPAGGLCLDDDRWQYVKTQAVTNNLNWRFDLRNYTTPTGSNAFGCTVQTGNIKRVASGNSCYNMNTFKMDYGTPSNVDVDRALYHDEASGCTFSGQDYGGITAAPGAFYYNTQLSVSSSRFPFGTAPYVNTDNGIDNYYASSPANTPISMWLLPP